MVNQLQKVIFYNNTINFPNFLFKNIFSTMSLGEMDFIFLNIRRVNMLHQFFVTYIEFKMDKNNKYIK